MRSLIRLGVAAGSVMLLQLAAGAGVGSAQEYNCWACVPNCSDTIDHCIAQCGTLPTELCNSPPGVEIFCQDQQWDWVAECELEN